MIVNHNHVAISSSIIKKSSYYKNHQLALIRLSQKMDMYCILAIKKDKLESKPIQEFIELLKKIFEWLHSNFSDRLENLRVKVQ